MTDTSLRRHAVGTIAAGLLVAAGALWLWQPSPDFGDAGMVGIFLRTGVVCGALWLAWPQIDRIHPWILIAALAGFLGMLYLFRQPRTLVLAAVIAIAVFKLRPKPPVKPARR